MKSLSFLITVIVVISCLKSAMAEVPVYLYYDERVPYAVKNEQGGVSGLTATPAANAFNLANIPFQWKMMPFKRQLMTIKFNKKRACGIGWFKKPERELFARFTHPIYQDRPTIVIGSAKNRQIEKYTALSDLLKDNSLKLLVKDSFSYGDYIDNLLGQSPPVTVTVAGSTNVEMLKMILSSRADYLFSAEEEAEQMIKGSGLNSAMFRLYDFSDIPGGNNRYIACSHLVSPETINRLNEALGDR